MKDEEHGIDELKDILEDIRSDQDVHEAAFTVAVPLSLREVETSVNELQYLNRELKKCKRRIEKDGREVNSRYSDRSWRNQEDRDNLYNLATIYKVRLVNFCNQYLYFYVTS